MLFISWLSEPRPRTVGRGPVPRRASVITETVRSLWAADGFRFGGRSRGTGPRATGQATFFVWIEHSRGTGPRATGTVAFCSSHRRARACPSPCLGLNNKRPWPMGCGRFSFRRRDCGKQIICLVSVGQDRPILTRSGSGDPELLRFILIQTTECSRGTGPRATVES